jgi:hypothetical protein
MNALVLIAGRRVQTFMICSTFGIGTPDSAMSFEACSLLEVHKSMSWGNTVMPRFLNVGKLSFLM